MKQVKTLMLILASFALLIAASACSSVGTTSTLTAADVLLTAEASSPLPTAMAGEGLRVVPAAVCLRQDYVTVSVNDQPDDVSYDPQGDLLAWNPNRDELAYLRPTAGRWGWFVGDLVVYDFELKKEIFTTTTLEVFGDLTWSPDGTNLAYVVLNPDEKSYTVYVGGLAQSLSTDIFGTSARTDDYSSKKGITGWNDSTSLLVTSSCGLDCSRGYNFNTDTQVLSTQAETRKSEDQSLILANQNTSPDGAWQVTVDVDNNVWLAKLASKTASIISTGKIVREIKWSASSKYLSIRFTDDIKIFDVTCKKQ